MIIGKINDKVFIDDLVFRKKEPKEIKWLSGERQQGKTYQLIKDQQKEIERLNNIIGLIRNNIDITMQIIKEQPTGNDEWILERLDGIKNIGKELKEGK